MVCFLLCDDKPPQASKAKGARGGVQNAYIDKQNNPHVFALGLKNACCTEPACCLMSFFGAPFGCTACWARKAVLEKYHNGVDDYVCCQGYVPDCCCIKPATMCQGSPIGLCLEGCCCPVFSVSIARLHLMDSKRVRPDPVDYQIIACSNCLQLISCILDILAIFIEALRDLAAVVDCIADLFTCSVVGCMGAQVHHEIKKDANGVVYVVAQGVPVTHGQAPGSVPVVAGTQVRNGAPETAEMER